MFLGKSGLSVWFDKVWEGIWENQVLSISSTKEIARLHTTGGTHWFVHVLVEKITSQVYLVHWSVHVLVEKITSQVYLVRWLVVESKIANKDIFNIFILILVFLKFGKFYQVNWQVSSVSRLVIHFSSISL